MYPRISTSPADPHCPAPAPAPVSPPPRARGTPGRNPRPNATKWHTCPRRPRLHPGHVAHPAAIPDLTRPSGTLARGAHATRLTEPGNLPIEHIEQGALIEYGHGSATTYPTNGKRFVFDSVTFSALSSALDGLSLRQRAIADNIANINTPDYHAKRVMFEQALADAVEAGHGTARATVAESLEPTRLNGNNVNLDTETLSSIDTMLRYQFATQAINGSFSSIRTALRTTS